MLSQNLPHGPATSLHRNTRGRRSDTLDEKLLEKGVKNAVWLFTTRMTAMTSQGAPLINPEDFEGVKSFVSPDFRLFFAHYVLHGISQGIGFVGAFDKRLPKYEHVMGDIYVGDHITIFDGVLRVWLGDGSVVETPFWDKIEVDPATGKITTMSALFSIAAVPEEYWKDLKPEDFA